MSTFEPKSRLFSAFFQFSRRLFCIFISNIENSFINLFIYLDIFPPHIWIQIHRTFLSLLNDSILSYHVTNTRKKTINQTVCVFLELFIIYGLCRSSTQQSRVCLDAFRGKSDERRILTEDMKSFLFFKITVLFKACGLFVLRRRHFQHHTFLSIVYYTDKCLVFKKILSFFQE